MKLVPANLLLYIFLIGLVCSGFLITLFWPGKGGLYSFIIFAAMGGFGVAYYIYKTKRNGGHLVCPVGSNCNTVVTSKYSKFFGISLEYLGMLYYAVTILAYSSVLFFPTIVPSGLFSLLLLFSTFGFLFSLYLLFIQAYVLRTWCIWCLLSAILSIVIFTVSLVSLPAAVSFLSSVPMLLDAVRSFGYALGVGGITAVMLIFGKCLKDLKIDEEELHLIKGIFEVVWFGFVLVAVGSLATYVVEHHMLTVSFTFFAQMIALLVAGFSGAVIMVIFTPFMTMLEFEMPNEEASKTILQKYKRPLFIAGAFTVASWYYSFFIQFLNLEKAKSYALSYMGVIVVAMIISLLWENVLTKREKL